MAKAKDTVERANAIKILLQRWLLKQEAKAKAAVTPANIAEKFTLFSNTGAPK